MITDRRICWPKPDATCLEGGCIHCDGHPMRAIALIRSYAQHAGKVPNRAHGEQDAMAAFTYGEDHGFHGGVEVRRTS